MNSDRPGMDAMRAAIRRFEGSADHVDCPRILFEAMAAVDAEVTVMAVPPLVRGPYTSDRFTCPHGASYWLEPTGEQIVAWVGEGRS